MTIIFHIDDYTFQLFDKANSDKNLLIQEIKDYFQSHGEIIDVKIENDIVTVDITADEINKEDEKYQHLIQYCESGKFDKAKSLAEELAKKHPTDSETHRILGQIYSELGNEEGAINSLIDALKWNPENRHALLMMGNVYAKKNETEIAIKYYNQVSKVDPDNYFAFNNIAANLARLGNKNEAIKYFHKAINIDERYPNAFLGLGYVYESDNDYKNAFKYALKALEKGNPNESGYNQCIKLAIDSAKGYYKGIKSTVAHKIVEDYKNKLIVLTDKGIKINVDSTINTAAKVELAETHKRDYHNVIYNDNYEAVEHLILHELTHIELAEEARRTDENHLFVTDNTLKNKFILSLNSFINNLRKKGVDKTSIDNYINALYQGINNQIFNTPIDLFIEDRIYNNFEELRPIQFLSLFKLINEGIEATTNERIVQNSPKNILSTSRIYNLVNALHFKDLFKIDIIPHFKSTKHELDQAESLFKEFLDYRKDKEAGEEYELLQHWAEDLKMNAYFNLIPESKHKRKSIDYILNEIENDPLGLNSENKTKDRDMQKFIDGHTTDDINNAVVMYMIEALNYFNEKSSETIKKIAFEFATLGMTGIDPNKDGYTIPSLQNKNMSGYQTLAFYYVSWALGMPEMVDQLQMPFDKEYKLATEFKSLQ